MDNDKILYDSVEISGIVSKIQEVDSVQMDIKTSLIRDFSLLQDLELFNDGLVGIKSEIDNLSYLNSQLVTCLNKHNEDMENLETKHLGLFNDYQKEENTVEEVQPAEQVTIDEIVLNKKTDGKLILTEYVQEVIPIFSYDIKVETLKNILKDDSNSLSILTDKSQSDILIYELKNILNEKYSIELSKLTNEEENEIQKSFFESIIDNDTNIFDEIDGNSFLKGLSFFKQAAQKNGITTSDLIFDEENNDKFMESINEIYNSEDVDVLTDQELDSVKNYIKEIADTNNLEVSEMLSNNKYSSVIKGGIYNED